MPSPSAMVPTCVANLERQYPQLKARIVFGAAELEKLLRSISPSAPKMSPLSLRKMASRHRRKFSDYTKLVEAIEIRNDIAHRRPMTQLKDWGGAYFAIKTAISDILLHCPEHLRIYESVNDQEVAEESDQLRTNSASTVRIVDDHYHSGKVASFNRDIRLSAENRWISMFSEWCGGVVESTPLWVLIILSVVGFALLLGLIAGLSGRSMHEGVVSGIALLVFASGVLLVMRLFSWAYDAAEPKSISKILAWLVLAVGVVGCFTFLRLITP